MYSGRQPASTALIAIFSVVIVGRRTGSVITPSPGSRPAASRKRRTASSVAGTTGRPSVHSRSKYASTPSAQSATGYSVAVNFADEPRMMDSRQTTFARSSLGERSAGVGDTCRMIGVLICGEIPEHVLSSGWRCERVFICRQGKVGTFLPHFHQVYKLKFLGKVGPLRAARATLCITSRRSSCGINVGSARRRSDRSRERERWRNPGRSGHTAEGSCRR